MVVEIIRIHFGIIGEEKDIGSFLTKKSAVLFKRVGIFTKILFVIELCGIHEDADYCD
jgi:hypothetical protein